MTGNWGSKAKFNPSGRSEPDAFVIDTNLLFCGPCTWGSAGEDELVFDGSSRADVGRSLAVSLQPCAPARHGTFFSSWEGGSSPVTPGVPGGET
jgi:hypothetical protein